MVRKSFYLFICWLVLLNSFFSVANAQNVQPTTIQVVEKTITVDGKPSQVFDITQPNGTFGLTGIKGQLFDVTVQNKTHVPFVLHWHGIIDPNDQDGVPYVTQLPIKPGESYHYQFKLKQAGTYWFHSHYKLQEQKLMAAPLIIYEPNEKKENEAIMFIQDFTYDDPKAIYSSLRKNLQKPMSMPMDEKKMPMSMPMDDKKMAKDMNKSTSAPKMTMDVSDVKFDAYLTNHKTLQNPDIVRVTPKQSFRLRIINGSASSNYYIDLGKLTGTLIAVDGEPIKPIVGSRFQLAIGNRLDIRLSIPAGEGAYPILALPEGTKQQTGLILATANAKLPVLPETITTSNPALDYTQERKLTALQPLPAHSVDQSLVFNLEGDMQSYRWTINGQEWPYITPYKIKPGKRIELVFNNKSGMAHPMHFHGHVFQVSEINGTKVNGRKGDTVDVMPFTSMKVILDSENPGIWMLHCHILYHQMGGMMTTINYEGYPDKFTTSQREEGESLYGISPFKNENEMKPGSEEENLNEYQSDDSEN